MLRRPILPFQHTALRNVAPHVLQNWRGDRISNAHRVLHWEKRSRYEEKIDIRSAPVSSGSRYPEPFAAQCQDKSDVDWRWRQDLSSLA